MSQPPTTLGKRSAPDGDDYEAAQKALDSMPHASTKASVMRIFLRNRHLLPAPNSLRSGEFINAVFADGNLNFANWGVFLRDFGKEADKDIRIDWDSPGTLGNSIIVYEPSEIGQLFAASIKDVAMWGFNTQLFESFIRRANSASDKREVKIGLMTNRAFIDVRGFSASAGYGKQALLQMFESLPAGRRFRVHHIINPAMFHLARKLLGNNALVEYEGNALAEYEEGMVHVSQREEDKNVRLAATDYWKRDDKEVRKSERIWKNLNGGLQPRINETGEDVTWQRATTPYQAYTWGQVFSALKGD